MNNSKIYSLVVDFRNLINNAEQPCYKFSKQQIFKWQIGQVSKINSMIFIPIMAVKCIRYTNQAEDEYDLIRVGEIYPVVMIFDKQRITEKRYIIINRHGRKQYWYAHDFEIIEPSNETLSAF